MGIQWGPVDEIPSPTNSTITDEWSDDNFSDVSQSMDELLDRNNTLDGQEEQNFFDSRLDPDALDEMAFDEVDVDEMKKDISGDKAFQEAEMPNFDAPAEGMPGYVAAGGGLLSGAVFGKARSFILSKLSSLRNMSNDDDDLGLGEVVDLDDLQNAGTSLGNNAYMAASESSRNGFGAANVFSATPPVGVESASAA
jgi:hypothetical protein